MKDTARILNAYSYDMPDTCRKKIFSSSDALGWQGIHAERGLCQYSEPTEVRDVATPWHRFSMLTSEHYEWEYKSGGRFRKETSRSGHIWIIPADSPFTLRTGDEKGYLALALAPQKLMEAARDDVSGIRGDFDVRFNVEDIQLGALMQALVAEAEAGAPNGKLFADSLTTALSVHFLRHYGTEKARISEYRNGLDRQKLNRASDYIESHLDEDISLDQMAREAGMSKYYFIRLFRQSTGVTPYQYLLRRRIERARDLLRKSGHSVSEVAYMAGFSDQSHLTRMFRKHYGVTPGAFQRGDR